MKKQKQQTTSTTMTCIYAQHCTFSKAKAKNCMLHSGRRDNTMKKGKSKNDKVHRVGAFKVDGLQKVVRCFRNHKNDAGCSIVVYKKHRTLCLNALHGS